MTFESAMSALLKLELIRLLLRHTARLHSEIRHCNNKIRRISHASWQKMLQQQSKKSWPKFQKVVSSGHCRKAWKIDRLESIVNRLGRSLGRNNQVCTFQCLSDHCWRYEAQLCFVPVRESAVQLTSGSKGTHIIRNNWVAATFWDCVNAVSGSSPRSFSDALINVTGSLYRLTLPLLMKSSSAGSSPWRISSCAGENVRLVKIDANKARRSCSMPLKNVNPSTNRFLSPMPSKEIAEDGSGDEELTCATFWTR